MQLKQRLSVCVPRLIEYWTRSSIMQLNYRVYRCETFWDSRPKRESP